MIGRDFWDQKLQGYLKVWPFKVEPDERGQPAIRIPLSNGEEIRQSPVNIAAHVLRRVVVLAEEFLGERVSQAVITVPAYFNQVFIHLSSF